MRNRNYPENRVVNFPKTEVILPVSKCFSKEDVEEFEETVKGCLNCSSSCRGKELAKYLTEVGLDEFKKKKSNNSLPEHIRYLLHSQKMAMNISHDNHALIYSKL